MRAQDRAVAHMTKPPKCLIVTSNFPPIRGGSAVVYENLCKFSNGSVLVLASKTDHRTGRPVCGWWDHDRDAPYTVYRIASLRSPPNPSRSRLHAILAYVRFDVPLRIRILHEIVTIIMRENVNVICIGELITGGWLVVPCRYLLRRKIITYIHGEEITTRTPGWALANRRKSYLRNSHSIVAVSTFTRDMIVNQMEIDQRKIQLIFNGVDLEKFSPRTKACRLASRYGLSGSRVLLSIGRLVERKGFDRVLYQRSLIRTHAPICACRGT